VRAVLARRDIPALYRALQLAGVSQRTIGERTGQLQSEVSDIIAGRQVTTVRLLERIVDGLGIPRQLVGLTTTPSADSDTSAVPTTVERRASSSLRRRVPPITRDIDPADAANVPLWTARDVWALRHALRHTVAEFARHLDVSNQMIKKWETGSTPRAFYQSLLDAALARADSTTQARFTRLASSNPGTEYARP
jgi:transcriptional regulator with XRE-family HTH domain